MGLLASVGWLGSVGNVWLQGRAGNRLGNNPWNTGVGGRLWRRVGVEGVWSSVGCGRTI